MSWGLWLSLLGATASASVLAVSQYFAWSFRYRIKWLGTTSELALAATILFLAGAGISALLDHAPWN